MPVLLWDQTHLLATSNRRRRYDDSALGGNTLGFGSWLARGSLSTLLRLASNLSLVERLELDHLLYQSRAVAHVVAEEIVHQLAALVVGDPLAYRVVRDLALHLQHQPGVEVHPELHHLELRKGDVADLADVIEQPVANVVATQVAAEQKHVRRVVDLAAVDELWVAAQELEVQRLRTREIVAVDPRDNGAAGGLVDTLEDKLAGGKGLFGRVRELQELRFVGDGSQQLLLVVDGGVYLHTGRRGGRLHRKRHPRDVVVQEGIGR